MRGGDGAYTSFSLSTGTVPRFNIKLIWVASNAYGFGELGACVDELD